MGHLGRTAAALVIVAAALVGASLPAAADCMGPTISYDPHEVLPGEAVEVLGSGWGDNCYDTGPPPAGEGVLGRPVRDIEIVVTQGDSEEVVGFGSADADYGFTVEARMPAWLEPGDAWVSARWARGAAFDQTAQPFVVLDGEPLDASDEPVTFGPAAPVEGSGDDGAEGTSGSAGPSLTVVVAAVMACVAAGVVVLLRPRTAVTTTTGDEDDQERGR